MNREMRRLAQREERRQKQQQKRSVQRGRRPQPRPGEQRTFLSRIAQFLREVRTELKRVAWPTRDQMVAFSAVTIITTAALTLIVFGFDVVLKEGVLALLRRGG